MKKSKWRVLSGLGRADGLMFHENISDYVRFANPIRLELYCFIVEKTPLEKRFFNCFSKQ